MNFCVPIPQKVSGFTTSVSFSKDLLALVPRDRSQAEGLWSSTRNKMWTIESLNKATPQTLDYDLKNGCFFVCRLWALPLSVTWIISQNSDGPTMGRHVHVYTMELFTFRHKSCLSLKIMLQQISLDTVMECSSKYRSSTTRSQEFRSPGGDNCFLWSLQFPFVW